MLRLVSVFDKHNLTMYENQKNCSNINQLSKVYLPTKMYGEYLPEQISQMDGSWEYVPESNL